MLVNKINLNFRKKCNHCPGAQPQFSTFGDLFGRLSGLILGFRLRAFSHRIVCVLPYFIRSLSALFWLSWWLFWLICVHLSCQRRVIAMAVGRRGRVATPNYPVFHFSFSIFHRLIFRVAQVVFGQLLPAEPRQTRNYLQLWPFANSTDDACTCQTTEFALFYQFASFKDFSFLLLKLFGDSWKVLRNK